MSTATDYLPTPTYNLQLDQAQVDLIVRGLFCLIKELPRQLDSVAPGTQREQDLLDARDEATLLIDMFTDLPNQELDSPGVTHGFCL